MILFTAINVSALYATGEEESCGFSLFSKWLEWKSSTNLSVKQRTVIGYLKDADEIHNRAFNTMFATPQSRYGYLDIKEAIKIIKNLLADLERMPTPRECKMYRKRCIKDLEYVLKYHELRLKYGDGTKEFEEKNNALELAYSTANSKSDIFSEFYNCLNRIGLMNNIKKELIGLRK